MLVCDRLAQMLRKMAGLVMAKAFANVSKSSSLNLTRLLSQYPIQSHYHHPARKTSFFYDCCKVSSRKVAYQIPQSQSKIRIFNSFQYFCTDSAPQHNNVIHEAVITENNKEIEASDTAGDGKVKRKKLKGKRAVVRWLKYFRWRKKKEYERMTAEEKILYKLKKARNKESRLVQALTEIDPQDMAEAIHDPEILTPEEHFYFLKMGHTCRNYVPVGRRGIYQGVILNIHLHWKKHQTLKVIVKTFTAEEVREIAAELAKLTGGIVLEIHEENTIIMYRGKNYVQPPTEIMSPKVTLSRKKALDKSKYRDALHAVRKFIPRLEQDLELLREQAKRDRESTRQVVSGEVASKSKSVEEISKRDRLADLLIFKKKERGSKKFSSDESVIGSDFMSESEALSDLFETDSESETEEKEQKPLYLDVIERFPSQVYEEPENFDEHWHNISAVSENSDPSGKDVKLSELDEVDKMFLQAGSLLKKKRK